MRRALTPAVLAAALLIAGCSTSGSAEKGTSTTAAAGSSTTAADGPSTTAAPTTDGTTTTTEAAGGRVTKAQLQALLPSPATLGPQWRIKPAEADDGEESPATAALKEQCPEAYDIGADTGVTDADKAIRTFADTNGTELEVKLNPKAKQYSAARFRQVLAAIGRCKSVTYQQSGFDATLDVTAEPYDDLGEQGLRLTLHLTLENPQLTQPLELEIWGVGYRVGPVGVTVTAADGIDEDAVEAIPGNRDLAQQVADALEPEVEDLVR